VREHHSGFVDNYQKDELEFLVNALEPLGDISDDEIVAVPVDSDPAPFGFCAMLNNYAADHGYKIDGQILDGLEFARYIGKPSERDGLVTGKIITSTGLKLRLLNR
jgi:hypothetical protein